VDAVNFVGKQPGADPSGSAYSAIRSAAISPWHSARRDPRIRAVVELAGGIEPELARTVTRLAPTLIVHGKEDGRVPFARATELQKVIEKIGAHVETEFLPNERHILSPMAAFRALARALEFFGTYLRGRRRSARVQADAPRNQCSGRCRVIMERKSPRL
jgi:hypothetical protein